MDGTRPSYGHRADPRLDGVFDVLADPTRRALLDVLGGTDVTTIDELAADLVEVGGHPFSGAATDGGTERLRAALYHVHLPKMASLGLIAYDPASGRVETTRATDAVRDVQAAVVG